MPPRKCETPLIANDRNLRVDPSEVDDLKASIAVVGILQPLVVTPIAGEPDHYRILIGHRRHVAATELGMLAVPCLVAATPDAAAQVVTMLAENVHRVGLSISEEAAAYHQLSLLDLSVSRIAMMTAKDTARVRDALALHQLPEAAKRAADTGQLTLDQVADLEELAAEDPKALARVLDRGKGSTWSLKHVIADEKARIQRRQAADRIFAELTLAGVRILPKPREFGYRSKEVEAARLVDANGDRLNPTDMQAKPGFAAYIDKQAMDGPKAIIFCTDAEAWGYTRVGHSSYIPEAEQARRTQAEAVRATRAQALTVAEGVRWEFIKAHYANPRVAKKVYLDALRDAVTNPDALHCHCRYAELADTIAGATIASTAAGAGIDRLTRMLVGRWVATAEQELTGLLTGYRVNRDDAPAAVAHLGRLVAAGYELSDIETQVRDELSALDTEDAEADDEDEDDGTDDDAAA